MERSDAELLDVALGLYMRPCVLITHLHRWLFGHKLSLSRMNVDSDDEETQAKRNL